MSARGGTAAAWTAVALLLAVYGGWALFPDAPLYRDTLTPRALLALSAVAKLAILLAGALDRKSVV